MVWTSNEGGQMEAKAQVEWTELTTRWGKEKDGKGREQLVSYLVSYRNWSETISVGSSNLYVTI